MSSPLPELPGRIELHSPLTPQLKMAPPTTSAWTVVPSPGPPGPEGPSGESAEQIRITRTAGAVLSGHRMVTAQADGTVVYASNDNAAHTNAPLWMTLGAVASGAEATALAYGPITEPSWSWTPGPLYLGTNGLITQTPPTAPAALFLVQIGFATGPTTAFIDRLFSIALI